LVPEAIVDGAVNRDLLGQAVLKDRSKLKELEAIVHPLVGKAQIDFFQAQIDAKQDMVLLDVPLLFETGGDGYVDTVIVVSAPAELQKARVLARPGMSEERFEDILSKQVPDAEKRERAEFIVDSSISIEDARRQVRAILAQLKGREGTALAARMARYNER
jgi:dephospho-CoA kinase